MAWVTPIYLPFTFVLDKAGIDLIIAGDSGCMVKLGYKSTIPVTMDEMITMAKTAHKDTPILF